MGHKFETHHRSLNCKDESTRGSCRWLGAGKWWCEGISSWALDFRSQGEAKTLVLGLG